MKGIRYHGWKKKEEYDSYIYIHRNRALSKARGDVKCWKGGKKKKRIHARLSSFIERRQTRSLVNYPFSIILHALRYPYLFADSWRDRLKRVEWKARKHLVCGRRARFSIHHRATRPRVLARVCIVVNSSALYTALIIGFAIPPTGPGSAPVFAFVPSRSEIARCSKRVSSRVGVFFFFFVDRLA